MCHKQISLINIAVYPWNCTKEFQQLHRRVHISILFSLIFYTRKYSDCSKLLMKASWPDGHINTTCPSVILMLFHKILYKHTQIKTVKIATSSDTNIGTHFLKQHKYKLNSFKQYYKFQTIP
jgi:hypothetical protein